MGWRFHRRMTIFPGVSMNFGKTGTSFSVGPRGMKTNISSRGISQSFGIPGTGLSYRTPVQKWSNSSVPHQSTRRKLSPAEHQQLVRQEDYQKLDLGFFAKLTLSSEEKSLVEGVRAYIAGDLAKAETSLKNAACYVDAAFTLGFIYLNSGRFDDAAAMFQQAERHPEQIGAFYRKYQLGMTLNLTISPFLAVDLPPDIVTAYLAHVEALQQIGKTTEACDILLSLYKQNPMNHLVIISLAELVLESSPNNVQWMNAIVNLTKNVDNETYMHAVMLMYKAEAFDNLKMYDAAITTLTSALRKKAGRPREFLIELQYQRGVLYARTGRKAQAVKDLNEVFAQDPDYADVRQRLAQLA